MSPTGRADASGINWCSISDLVKLPELLCSEVLGQCWIYSSLSSVGQAGVNPEWICACRSESVMSYSLPCISNPCKL